MVLRAVKLACDEKVARNARHLAYETVEKLERPRRNSRRRQLNELDQYAKRTPEGKSELILDFEPKRKAAPQVKKP